MSNKIDSIEELLELPLVDEDIATQSSPMLTGLSVHWFRTQLDIPRELELKLGPQAEQKQDILELLASGLGSHAMRSEVAAAISPFGRHRTNLAIALRVLDGYSAESINWTYPSSSHRVFRPDTHYPHIACYMNEVLEQDMDTFIGKRLAEHA